MCSHFYEMICMYLLLLSTDNQEVYQDCTEESGAVLVIEILEHQNDVKNEDAATFFFDDLADANGVSQEYHDTSIQSSMMISMGDDNDAKRQKYFPSFNAHTQQLAGAVACMSIGKQQVVDKCLRIEMCVLRLKNVTTDLLITLSTPENKPISIEKDGFTNVFHEVLSTFSIKDWTLFC